MKITACNTKPATTVYLYKYGAYLKKSYNNTLAHNVQSGATSMLVYKEMDWVKNPMLYRSVSASVEDRALPGHWEDDLYCRPK